MDYSAPGLILVLLLTLLGVAPAIAATSWDGGRDLAVALLRTGEVLAAVVVLLLMVELTRQDALGEDVEVAALMACFFVALLVGLFAVEQHVGRSGAQVDVDVDADGPGVQDPPGAQDPQNPVVQ